MLRGLAALAVVVFHAFQWLDADPDTGFWIGAAGVDVFFVISGFIIWTVTARGESAPGIFLWRRFTRVAPSYWLATGVVAAIVVIDPKFLPQISVTASHLALSLAFIQHNDPNGLAFPVLPPGWSLNYEALFYVTFAAVLFAPAKWRFALIVAAMAAICGFGVLYPPAYGFIANPMMLQFAAGAWLGRRHALGRKIAAGAGAAFILIALAMLTLMYVTDTRNEYFRPLLWGLPAVAIVAGAVALEEGRAFKAPTALVRLGDASYAIYLCHLMTVALVAHLVGVHPPILFVPVAVVVSIAVGMAFHRWIEQPLIALFRGAGRRLAHLMTPARPRPG